MKLIMHNDFLKNIIPHKKSKCERCGILVGKKLKEDEYLVSKIIEDKNPIHCGPFAVTRNIKNVYSQLLDEIDKDQSLDYLGEWHTHPFGPNSPSLVDIMSIKEMINNPLFGTLDWIIMVVFFPNSQQKAYFFTNEIFQEMEIEICY